MEPLEVPGNLDNILVAEAGFTEDSLRVFYRENASDDWEVVSDIQLIRWGLQQMLMHM